MLFLINNLLINNFMLINSQENINPLNSFLITTTLMLFIVISLYLTFYQKGNAVHKVLGLLLSSIFIVFLWIMQTQFLFIYLVYILAFISAVLMLFLSVVLMLPISTLNNSVNKNYLYPIISVEFLEYFTLEAIFLVIIFYNLFYVINKNYIKYLFQKLMKNEKYNESYTAVINNYLISKFNVLNNSFVYSTIYYTIKFFNITLTFIKLGLNNCAYYFYYFFFIISNIGNINKQKLLDIFTQLYLFINMIIVVILSQISINNTPAEIILEEKVLGLGVLKDLLYNQYPSFLIVSTVVLLVALIGSAVMTKKIK